MWFETWWKMCDMHHDWKIVIWLIMENVWRVMGPWYVKWQVWRRHVTHFGGCAPKAGNTLHDLFTCVTSLIMCDVTHCWYMSRIHVFAYQNCGIWVRIHIYAWQRWILDHVTFVVPRLNMWDMTRSYAWHDSRDMTHSHVSYDSIVCVTWLLQMCHAIRSHVWLDSIIYMICRRICETWLVHMCDMTRVTWLIHMTRLYVSRDSFSCVTGHNHMCDTSPSHVPHDSSIRVPWLIHVCDTTLSYVWPETFTCVTCLLHMCPV